MANARPDGTKWCGKCKRMLTVDDFHRVSTNTDGRAARCKACRSEYSKKYMREYNRTRRERRARRAQQNAADNNATKEY